jgi:hypothetical protein
MKVKQSQEGQSQDEKSLPFLPDRAPNHLFLRLSKRGVQVSVSRWKIRSSAHQPLPKSG